MADFSEINKRGGSYKACSWENFLKKNKKNSMLIKDFRVGKICNARRIIFHVLNSSCVIKGSLLMIGKIQLMHFCTQFPNIRSGKMCPRAIKTSSKLLWKNILLQLQEKQQQQTSFLVSFSQKFMWFMFGNELRFF